MESEKEFYSICPTKGCRTISGFTLTDKQIRENGKYFCIECSKESTLSKWKKSTKGAMDKQKANRELIAKYKITKNLSKKIMVQSIKNMLIEHGFKKPKARVIQEIIKEL